MNIPVLGALFKSRDYINRQTELMVLVTPYIVRAVAQKDLSRPDDGYADAPRTPRPRCSAASTGSTACPARTIRARTAPAAPIAAMSASSWIESGDKERSMHNPMLTDLRRVKRLAIRGSRSPDSPQPWRAARPPSSTRPPAGRFPERAGHAIRSPSRSKKTLMAFVGTGRGRLTAHAARRGAVVCEELAARRRWRRADRPARRQPEANARPPTPLQEARCRSWPRPASESNSGIGNRPHQAGGEKDPPLRFSFPQMVAEAGPCGTWPDDVGPSYDPKHYENR